MKLTDLVSIQRRVGTRSINNSYQYAQHATDLFITMHFLNFLSYVCPCTIAGLSERMYKVAFSLYAVGAFAAAHANPNVKRGNHAHLERHFDH